MTDNPFRKQIEVLREQHERKISTDLYSERTERCEAAQVAVRAAFDSELQAKRRELQALETLCSDTVAGLREHAEQHRLACARTLLQSVFDAGDAKSIVNLVKRWRVEPSRSLTTELLTRWLDLDKQAQAQLGEGLNWHLLAQALADDILLTHPGGVVALAEGMFGCTERMMSALHGFATAPSPHSAQQALEIAEDCLLVSAQGTSYPVEPRHLRCHALRRENATRSDLTLAWHAHEQEIKQAYQREYERTAAPPPQPSLVGRAIQWIGSA